MHQHRPDNPGILVRQRHSRDVFVATQQHLAGPSTRRAVIRLAISYQHHSTRTMNEQGSQIGIPTLADAQEVLLTAAGMLPGYQPKPGSQLATILKALGIAQRCDQGTGRDRSYPRYLLQAFRVTLLRRISNSITTLHAYLAAPDTASTR